MTDDRRISDEEAREIWRHAARLQGAAERAEARDRLAGAWSGAALGMLLGGGVGVRAYRKVYAWAVTKGDSAVRRLASAIAVKAERDAA